MPVDYMVTAEGLKNLDELVDSLQDFFKPSGDDFIEAQSVQWHAPITSDQAVSILQLARGRNIDGY
eukprot:12411691-Karenia_brevis.AAC.1